LNLPISDVGIAESGQIAPWSESAQKLSALQQRTSSAPYSIIHRLKLAQAYKALGYPDLAAGDAYKALLLIDEVVEEGEYHEEAFEAAQIDFASEKLSELEVHQNQEANSNGENDVVAWAQSKCSRVAYVSPQT
jgi:hypothetical protein